MNEATCECCGSHETTLTNYGNLCGWCLQDLEEKEGKES